MAIADAKERKIGRELVEWLYLGLRTGIRKGVAEYQALKVADPTEAVTQLKRAMDLPHRVRARIDHFISQQDGKGGPNAGINRLNAALNSFGAGKSGPNRVSMSDIDADIVVLENQMAALKVQAPDPYGNAAMTWDDLATALEATIENEIDDWRFEIPPGYTDIWGE